MAEHDHDINAAILAELKQMNESLTYIRAVAQRVNDQHNRNAQAQASLEKYGRGL